MVSSKRKTLTNSATTFYDMLFIVIFLCSETHTTEVPSNLQRPLHCHYKSKKKNARLIALKNNILFSTCSLTLLSALPKRPRTSLQEDVYHCSSSTCIVVVPTDLTHHSTVEQLIDSAVVRCSTYLVNKD